MGEVARAALASVVRKLRTIKVGHRITDSAIAAWVCGDGAAVAELRYGARAVVFINDYVGRAMYLWGEHDPRITSVLDAVLRPGDTVLDIGANFGVVGLFACKKVGEQGKVHLFEPQPAVAQFLRTSMLINGYRQAVIHECALSSRSGSAEMAIIDAGNLGMATLVSEDKQLAAERIRVRVENAGEFVRTLECQQVSLIKIDVEGHEGVVLESMRDWMQEVKPGVVLFECHVGKDGFWSENVVTLLSGMGYEFLAYDLRKYWSTQLYRVTKEMNKPAGHDFVAVRPGGLKDDVAQELENMTKPHS
jgi:FkbM family methyltransferase